MKEVYLCYCTTCDKLHIDQHLGDKWDQKKYKIEEDSVDELYNGYHCSICKQDEDNLLVLTNKDNYNIELAYSHTIESIEIWKYQLVDYESQFTILRDIKNNLDNLTDEKII